MPRNRAPRRRVVAVDFPAVILACGHGVFPWRFPYAGKQRGDDWIPNKHTRRACRQCAQETQR